MKKNPLKIVSKYSSFLMLALIIFLLAFMLWPTRSKILELKQGIINQRANLEEQYINGQLLKEVSEQYITIEPQLPQVNATVLKPGQELFLITTLEQIAQQYNLEQDLFIDSLVSDQADQSTDLVALPLSVNLLGSYQDVVSYLAKVEKLSFYVNWQKIVFKTTQLTGRAALPGLAPGQGPGFVADTDTIRADLSGETYWRVN